RAPAAGRGYSVIFRVSGSMLPSLLVLNRSKNGICFELSLIPYGRELGVGAGTSLIAPDFGSSVPTKLPACTVNHRIPRLSKTGVWGSRALGSGILYSVTLPVFASTLPMRPAAFPVYQIL